MESRTLCGNVVEVRPIGSTLPTAFPVYGHHFLLEDSFAASQPEGGGGAVNRASFVPRAP